MPLATDTATCPAIYRPRHPAATVMHRTVREHLETFLALAQSRDLDLRPVRPAAERALREYLRCGIAAHGFARVRCASCKHEYLVPFSCKVRDLCPSCGTRRMVETAAHLVDDVLPRVPYRQWVVSMPKRVRWFLKHKPEVVDGLAKIFLRAVQSTLRQGKSRRATRLPVRRHPLRPPLRRRAQQPRALPCLGDGRGVQRRP